MHMFGDFFSLPTLLALKIKAGYLIKRQLAVLCASKLVFCVFLSPDELQTSCSLAGKHRPLQTGFFLQLLSLMLQKPSFSVH